MTSNSSSSQNSLDQRLWRLSSVRAPRSSFPFDPESDARPRRTSHPFFLTGSLTFSPVVVFATTRALLSPPRVRQADTLVAAPPVVLVVIMCALSERSRASSGSTVRRSRARLYSLACSRARAPERVYVRASPCVEWPACRRARGVGSCSISDVVTSEETLGTSATPEVFVTERQELLSMVEKE
jgi:hypothetical protein